MKKLQEINSSSPTSASRQTGDRQVKIFEQSLFERWILFAQVKEKSAQTYLKGIRQLAKYFAAKKISSPTREDFLKYRDWLRKNFSVSTANLYLVSARLFFEFLHTEQIISNNPVLHLKGFRQVEGHKKDALAPEDVKEILAAIDTSTLTGKRNKAIFALMVGCGLRCVEVSRANVDDITRRGRKIFLYVQGKGHDEKDAVVKIPDKVFEIIQEYLTSRGKAKGSESLFKSQRGRLTPETISHIVKSCMRRAGYDSKRLTAHSLRHTCATNSAINGANLLNVKQMLRHKSIKTTQIYIEELDRLDNDAEDRAAENLF